MPGNSAVLDDLLNALEARQKERGGSGGGRSFGYARQYGYGYGAKAVDSPANNYVHGPGGIFGVSGLERDVLSTRIAPRGIVGELQAQGSRFMNPLFPYITGFLADTGSDADAPCDDPMTAGYIKGCLQTAQFGRYEFQTSALELNRVGQQIDRGEFMDLRLVNDPLLQQMGGVLSGFGGGMGGGVGAGGMGEDINRETLTRWLELGVAFQNKLIRQVWDGNPANNSAGGGYKEFPGFNILIGTNKVDAITGVDCPSLNSDIKNFKYGLVDDGDPDIVEYVTYMFRYLRHNADRMGFNPVDWRIVMREELFYEITAVWPCSYLTYRCTFRDSNSDTTRLNVDAGDAIALRDQMRQGNYLLIDGMQVPVTIDDGIVEETNTTNANVPSGQFSSDIYFVPLAVRGGFMTAFMQYLDYTGAYGAMEAAQAGHYGDYYWTDGGRFLWTKKPPQNWCVQWLAKIEPRVILLTPQLAGRIQNVRYSPLQHTREPFPDDPYFVNGGVTSRTGPSYYSDWNLPS